eukprot:5308799-Lingulodinium_polyedra.AAC.1
MDNCGATCVEYTLATAREEIQIWRVAAFGRLSLRGSEVRRGLRTAALPRQNYEPKSRLPF